MNYRQPELLDRLAAAYALGTLRGRARARFERLCLSLPEAQAARHRWEDRLLPLALQLKPERVSAMGYSAVRARIDDASTGGGHDDAHDSHDGATAPARPAPTRGWRWLAAASILGFALLFGRVLLQGQPSWQPMAALAQANAPTQWQVERTRDSSRIRLRTVGEAVAPNGGSYELWVVPAAGGAPVSLGILPARGEVARLLNAQQQALLQTAQNVAVSLEPGGGSRNGAPTTVLFAAPVAAVT